MQSKLFWCSVHKNSYIDEIDIKPFDGLSKESVTSKEINIKIKTQAVAALYGPTCFNCKIVHNKILLRNFIYAAVNDLA